MAAPHEQFIASTRPDGSVAEESPDARRLDHMGYRDFEVLGEAAYARARELEKTLDLEDPKVAQAYREAATHLTAVTWMAPNEEVLDDPLRVLKVADSLAKLAQSGAVEPYGEQQYDMDGNPIEIDRRENLQRISSDMLMEAGRILMGSRQEAEISAAVAEATEEAGGMAEVVVLRPERVSQTAEHAIEQITGEHELAVAA